VKRAALGCAAAVALAITWPAQTPPGDPSHEGFGFVALHQALCDAATDTRALIVASHPDDRYVMPAAYLRFEHGWDVAALLLTRGEGGQNSQGPEIGDDLGRIRTLEAEAGAALLDTRIFYLNRPDGGYCLTADEALRLWGEQATLRDFARILRVARPDVVLTTHDPEEPHGHDRALLELLPRAATLAADAAFATPGLEPIAIPRVFRGASAGEQPSVVLPMTQLDRVRGRTYRELAYAALGLHRSQEPIQPMETLFSPVVALQPVPVQSGVAPQESLDTGLPSLFADWHEDPGLAADLRRLAERGAGAAPDQLVAQALELRRRLRAADLPAGSDADARRMRRIAALDRAVRLASGLSVRAVTAADHVAVPGFDLEIDIRVHNAGPFEFRNLALQPTGGASLTLQPSEPQSRALAHPTSGPPFTVKARYRLPPDAGDESLPFRSDTFEPPIRLECAAELIHDGAAHRLAFPVVVPAEVRRSVELQVIPAALLLAEGRHSIPFAVRIKRHAPNPLSERLTIAAQAGFVVQGSPATVEMTRAAVQDFPFVLRVPNGQPPGVYTLHVRLGAMRATVPVHKLEVTVPDDLSVGLIRGVDDAARVVLSGLVGRRLHVFGEEDLAVRDLHDLDTIVVDIRALRPRRNGGIALAARAAFSRLLAFARDGGRLVVFYHKDTEFNVADTGFEGAPYQLHIGKGRITQEDAPVEILLPDHGLLQRPNRIRAQDWDGWVQERGLYFLGERDPRYRDLVELDDPFPYNAGTKRGALVEATVGKGRWYYVGLGLWRQLPAGTDGAYTLMANLISLGS
jgi:LmbE family N-acetylglucosaminyl deacetylase